jgi:hypothetical protein
LRTSPTPDRAAVLPDPDLSHADDPVSRQRFATEAEITGGLEHPDVVPVYGLGIDAEGRPCYALRCINGDSLTLEVARDLLDEPERSQRIQSVQV